VQRWQGLDDVPGDWGSSVVTIGVFDGVHRGHQRIVGRAAEAAARLDLPVVVITFDPHPMEVVRPGSHPPLLCTVRRRVQLLGGEGCDAVCVLPFTLDFSRLGPDDFVRAVLADRLHARWVVVGDNFRFGHRAAGDVPLLAELGEKYDFGAEGVPLLSEARHGEAGHGEAGHGEAEHGDGGEPGVTISSSRIRDLLGQGDVAAAAGDLGRPHRVEGVVVRGQQRGRALGFPTANLETAPHTAVPADGVYAGWLLSLDAEGLEEQRWPAAISVGTNPTFDGREQTVEAYALDRDDLDLYGLHMAVDFTARLRGMVRFDSAAALTEQMRRDVDEARDLVGGSR
jgi:riboflavin kinase/FMN adenylyltransferase